MNFIKNSIKTYLPKPINIIRSFSTLDKKFNTKFDAKSDGQTLYKKSLFDKKIDFLEYFTKKELDLYVKENIIEICPLGFIQGRTFKDAIIIADEMQNSSTGQMFMLLTRIGTNSKMIVNGDLTQTSMRNNGLEDLIGKINKKWSDDKDELQKNNLSLIELQHNDIQRHEMVKKVITLYNKN